MAIGLPNAGGRYLLQTAVSENLRKSISADFENRLKMADESNKENEEKLKVARQKELEYLQAVFEYQFTQEYLTFLTK